MAAPKADRPGVPARERRALLRILRARPEAAAPALLGQLLVRRTRGHELVARIVETEAYLGADDPAAHSFRGQTQRTAPIWGPPGTIYVYFIYGLHHCLNLAVDLAGTPGCVLIRAAEPLGESGLEPLALSGPGRLCRALGIDRRLSGRHVFEDGARLSLRAGVPVARPGVSARIGIRKAAERPLRFFDPESVAVSGRR